MVLLAKMKQPVNKLTNKLGKNEASYMARSLQEVEEMKLLL
jgi:hypothetical protein